MWPFRSFSKPATSEARRLGVVHHREREFLVVDLQADQPRLIAEHRLGGGDRLARIFLAHFGDLGVQRFQRVEELRLALLIIRLVGRVDGGEIGGQRLGRRLHVGRIVPEMRIVAGLAADQRADDDFLAARRLVGAEQLLHPGIVVDAVDDDDLGVGERLGGLGARLEQMRILVGIGQDAGHRDIRAADLGRRRRRRNSPRRRP